MSLPSTLDSSDHFFLYGDSFLALSSSTPFLHNPPRISDHLAFVGSASVSETPLFADKSCKAFLCERLTEVSVFSRGRASPFTYHDIPPI